MSSRSGHVRELFARLLTDAHSGLAALGDQPRNAVVVALAGHHHVVESSPAGPEGLFHRVNAVQDFHKKQFISLSELSRAVLMSGNIRDMPQAQDAGSYTMENTQETSDSGDHPASYAFPAASLKV
jgi:hypothetical protein